MVTRRLPADDLDMDQLAEAELARLKRQYRIMEGDRGSYAQESNIVLKRQRKIIKILEAEKQELLTNLTVAKSCQNETKDSRVAAELERLQDVIDKSTDDIKSEKLQLSELKWQIKKVERELVELKKHDISDRRVLQRELKTRRNISNLENRLGVTTEKFNMMVATNGKLREEINHLLKERTYFNKLYQQLVGRFNAGKKMMVDLVEQATLAYDQREEAQNKLRALKDRGKQDLLQQSQEMRELQRRLDHDIKLQDFLGVKGQQRIMADLEAKEAQKRKKKREAAEHLIATYEDILSQIKEFTGECEIDRLTAQFVKQEEENFAIFNYVNELNNEVELLQDQVCELRKKIDDQRDVNNRRALEEQETLARLAYTLAEKRKSADTVANKLEECEALLKKLLDGINRIFHLVRCDNAPILSLLGDNAQVTSYNVMLYLGIIGRRTNDLMSVVYYMEHMDDKPSSLIQEEELTKPHLVRIEEMVPTNPCPLD
ncbi:coiled-coil domain-containing protein 63 isoform X2 [Periplaneta americana]|uniref:coiled-coil domain-containing protein 63 isoform X2 n=1 Tax=Periplaneta americana TaxID=6978 RepID=UPI0037E99EF1